MENIQNYVYHLKNLLSARYPVFATEIAEAKFIPSENLKYHTAGTNGKDVLFDPQFFESITDEQKLFILAHEFMHIKFRHIQRLRQKDGTLRDIKLWGKATDAIINANLEQDGFKIMQGFINIPQAINFSAEELYDILLKNSKQNGKEGQNGSSQKVQKILSNRNNKTSLLKMAPKKKSKKANLHKKALQKICNKTSPSKMTSQENNRTTLNKKSPKKTTTSKTKTTHKKITHRKIKITLNKTKIILVTTKIPLSKKMKTTHKTKTDNKTTRTKTKMASNLKVNRIVAKVEKVSNLKTDKMATAKMDKQITELNKPTTKI
jgi:predicted metal-dependent peptidase